MLTLRSALARGDFSWVRSVSAVHLGGFFAEDILATIFLFGGRGGESTRAALGLLILRAERRVAMLDMSSAAPGDERLIWPGELIC